MNENIDSKLNRLLADMPKQEYDLDAWLQEDETATFDRIVSRRKRTVWPRVAAAAACLFIIIGIGVILLPKNNPRLVRTCSEEPAPQSKTAPNIALQSENTPNTAPQSEPARDTAQCPPVVKRKKRKKRTFCFKQ